MAPKKVVRNVEEDDVVQDPTAGSSTDLSIEELAARLLNMDLDEMEKYEGKFKEIAKDALAKMKMVHDKSRKRHPRSRPKPRQNPRQRRTRSVAKKSVMLMLAFTCVVKVRSPPSTSSSEKRLGCFVRCWVSILE